MSAGQLGAGAGSGLSNAGSHNGREAGQSPSRPLSSAHPTGCGTAQSLGGRSTLAITDSAQTATVAGASTASEVLDFAAEHNVEMVDLKFVDLPGTWQHMTLPLRALDGD